MSSYILTPEAEMDLVDIWFYTARKWDREQANKYLSQLHFDFDQLAKGKLKYRPCTKLFPQGPPELSLYLSGRHYIIFRQRGDILEVLTVLHGASFGKLTEFLENY